MRHRKNNLILSVVAVLTVASLLAGATAAWFTDTKEVSADFEAGILDVELSGLEQDPAGTEVTVEELSFKNLRPMKLESFNALGKDQAAGSDSRQFQKIQVTNAGSLPVYFAFQLEEQTPPEGETLSVCPNTFGGVQKPDDEHLALLCHNDLKDRLQVLLYTEEGEQIADVDLMQAPYGKEEAQRILVPAGESKTYYLGGYLPEDTPNYVELPEGDNDYNMYNGGHYHAKLVAVAWQVDAGASSPSLPD
ncbi:SipW-dependent-type signal peptide-containing protein [Clostridium sp. D33t1_170424_F3]|uniref:SipW-dependent-type signal peptide-containing protein n=1 Tax=Clostridium sp. D33t1_170424_F3 TaxID=2787099 RepID=UPI0018AC076B|nr:SipW-dependent-type signal peptide-containing protein [Clostridium sp. D33t1_170424_F3]